MPNAECPICMEFVSYKNIQFFACGHGVCKKTCLKPLRNDQHCPICRQLKVCVDEPEDVFMRLDDTPGNKVECTVDKLNRIPENASADVIYRAGRAVLRIADDGSTDPATTKGLVKALANLLERISPAMKPSPEIQRLITDLTTENTNLKTQLQQMELRYRKLKSASAGNAAHSAAEVERLRDTIKRFTNELASERFKVRELENQLEESKRAYTLEKAKTRAVFKQRRRTSTTSADGDASLIVTKPDRPTPESSTKRRVRSNTIEQPKAAKRPRSAYI